MALPDFSQLQQAWKDRQTQIDSNINTLNDQIGASGSKYVRNPMNSNQLMLVQTGTSASQQESALNLQEKTIIAQSDVDKSLAESKKAKLDLQNTQLQQQTGLSVADRSKIVQSLGKLNTIYSDLSSASSKVNKHSDAILSWITGTAGKVEGQYNQNVRSLLNTKADLLTLVKGLTGVGRITNQEIDFMEKYMLPNPTDTKANASDKLNRLKGFIDELKSEASTGAGGSTTQRAQSDPLGIMGGQ